MRIFQKYPLISSYFNIMGLFLGHNTFTPSKTWQQIMFPLKCNEFLKDFEYGNHSL